MSRRAYSSYADNDREAPARPIVCELELNVGVRLIVCAVVCAILVVIALVGRSFNLWFLALLAILASVLYAGWLVLLRRAWLEITPELRVRTRRFGGFHTVDGATITGVKEIIAGRSPDVRLLTDAGSVVVPTSRLAGGHRVLFVWLHQCAPQATYDKGAARIRQILANDGWNVGLDKTA